MAKLKELTDAIQAAVDTYHKVPVPKDDRQARSLEYAGVFLGHAAEALRYLEKAQEKQ